MKRSEIDRYIDEAIAVFDLHGFKLPPWAYWTADQWAEVGDEANEIRDHQLGWDLTDFGRGDFLNLGLLLFTLRNGLLKDGQPVTNKTYAEKAMIVRPKQLTPWHFHWQKTEDIINRGGGRLVIELGWAGEDAQSLTGDPVAVQCDGVTRTVEPRGSIELAPGESITLPPRLAHAFYGRAGDEKVFVGEVSSVNDDRTDNAFLDPLPRFPAIDEDQPARHLLCNEYPRSA